MLRRSIQRMHCVLCMLCLFANTVNTKIKACNALNAMFWFLWLLHNTVYTALRCENSTYSTLYTGPLTPPIGKAIVHCTAFHLVGLAVYQSVQGGSFLNFLGLVNYKGDCRQDAQPIPNS